MMEPTLHTPVEPKPVRIAHDLLDKQGLRQRGKFVAIAAEGFFVVSPLRRFLSDRQTKTAVECGKPKG